MSVAGDGRVNELNRQARTEASAAASQTWLQLVKVPKSYPTSNGLRSYKSCGVLDGLA